MQVSAEGVRETTRTMIANIVEGGEARVLQYCRDLDKFPGTEADIIVGDAELADKFEEMQGMVKRDIVFADSLFL